MRWVLALMLLSFASVTQARAPTLAPGARPYTLSEQLRLRDSQVDILRQEKARKRLGGPVTALLVSTATASLLLTIGPADMPAAAMSPIGLIGLGGTVASSVWLGKVVHDRRALRREIHRLETKRFYPDGVSASLGPKQSMLTYTLRF
jgi:hypothetical protein